MLKTSADRMTEIIQEGLEPMTLHFEKWLSLLESARRTVSDLIHASPEEIAFTTNTLLAFIDHHMLNPLAARRSRVVLGS